MKTKLLYEQLRNCEKMQAAVNILNTCGLLHNCISMSPSRISKVNPVLITCLKLYVMFHGVVTSYLLVSASCK